MRAAWHSGRFALFTCDSQKQVWHAGALTKRRYCCKTLLLLFFVLFVPFALGKQPSQRSRESPKPTLSTSLLHQPGHVTTHRCGRVLPGSLTCCAACHTSYVCEFTQHWQCSFKNKNFFSLTFKLPSYSQIVKRTNGRRVARARLEVMTSSPGCQ